MYDRRSHFTGANNMTRTSWKDKATTLAAKMHLGVHCWNPGDGVKIKVSLSQDADYFGVSDADLLFRSGSWKDVNTFLQGFTFGVHSQMMQDK